MTGPPFPARSAARPAGESRSRRKSPTGFSAKRRPKMQRHDGYRLIIGAPVPAQAEAITLGRNILVRRRAADHDPLIAHELVHVRQFQELGAVRFFAKYIGSYLRGRLGGYGHMAAYRRIPLEVEACWLSRVHGRAALEPGGSKELVVSAARAPRAVVSRRLQDQAERLTRDALPAALPGALPAGSGRFGSSAFEPPLPSA